MIFLYGFEGRYGVEAADKLKQTLRDLPFEIKEISQAETLPPLPPARRRSGVVIVWRGARSALITKLAQLPKEERPWIEVFDPPLPGRPEQVSTQGWIRSYSWARYIVEQIFA